MLWCRWSRRLKSLGIPRHQLPPLLLLLARTLRRCPLPMPTEWETLVQDAQRANYLLWLYPWMDVEWISMDGVVQMRTGRPTAISLLRFEQLEKQIGAHYRAVNMHGCSFATVLWWERKL